MYGELVDEKILNANRDTAKISIFVPKEKNLAEYVEYINAKLPEQRIEYTLSLEGLDEDDWSEGWKKYFKPIPLGKLTIVPAWEDYVAKDGEVIIKIDPGMAFGTGTHETTRLVMRLMQNVVTGGEAVLDVGCGSGILSIAAARLGASKCRAYDIDPVAVKVAAENVERDSLSDVIEVGISDLLAGVKLQPGGYDLCVANIVADIIIRMLPDVGAYLKPHAPIILSGIVAEREAEVKSFAEGLGYKVLDSAHENDWAALIISK
jgi:ribosomal protein L11 methyltransferase